jgi:arylsulfatase B
MTFTRNAKILGALTAIATLLLPRADAQASSQAPNVIVIMADDLGYGDTSVYGSTIIKTPNIDALAADGVRFTRGYVTHPVCAPSRAALMTGRYQERFGYEFNPVGRDRDSGVDPNQVMLPALMKSAGYVTGLVGKWHLGSSKGYHPLDRGFDEYFGVLTGATSFMLSLAPGDDEYTPPGSEASTRTTPPPPGPDTRPADVRMQEMRAGAGVYRGRNEVVEPAYLTEAFTREAVSFISRNKTKPFFLYLAHTAPHTPLQATKKYLDRYRHVEDRGQRIYAAMVSALDDGVGEIRQTLQREGLSDRTLIVFLSDNGCAGYVLGACTNAPLSGFKGEHLEGGVRIPFILSWPGRLPAGRIDASPASSLDIAATAVALSGTRPSVTLDGRNLMPRFTGADTALRTLFWRAGPTQAMIEGGWKLWVAEKAGPDGAGAGEHVMLFDLQSDPAERTNLARARPEIVAAMRKAFDAWSSQMSPPQWESRRQSIREYDGEKLKAYN